jgi:DNA polymerase-1
MQPVVLDFETEAIDDRPKYPPKPVGLAVLDPEGEWSPTTGMYLTDRDVLVRYLRDLRGSGRDVLFHNGKFDQEVALEHLGIPLWDWNKAHDTLFQLFLADPHQMSLSLKPAAAHWLNLPPDEQDAVRQWLERHGVVRKGDKNWGAHISRAPRGLTGKYAVGDCVRTLGLHNLFIESFDEGMMAAYNRERQLMPILLNNERVGMRVNIYALKRDIDVYTRALERADAWLRLRLNSPTINLDSDAEVAAAFRREGIVTDFVKTKTGRDSTSKKNLSQKMYTDQRVYEAKGYRDRLATALSQSMIPWLEMAERNDGYIYTSWNQVRQAHGNDGAKGTRTGRLSCSRFQNITKDWYDKGDYVYPAWLGVPDLPLVRRYVLGDEGDLFCHRDYNQQEFRILAHYEDADLARAYRASRKTDMHRLMLDLIFNIAHQKFERRPIKIINFMELYGGGTPKMAQSIGTDTLTVKAIRAAKAKAAPGIQELTRAVQRQANSGQYIRTWGGRMYYKEPDKMINGRMVNFAYKMLNYLIQGSAADCTKQAIIDYDKAKKHGRFLVSVHDEINFSCPLDKAKQELSILRDVMYSVQSNGRTFDVPMYSDAKWGWSWGSLTKVEQEELLLPEVA